MNQMFKIGELVIMQNATHFDEYNGAIGVIVDVLKLCYPTNLNTMNHEKMLGYTVKILIEHAPEVKAAPEQLRKLRSGEQSQMESKVGRLLVSH